ncbi:suppressor of fused domain protein [Mucilaginibacter sp. R-33]|uniref:suppressor of fused domain protein n=1 Tax=Mucilaginibacter sp. R-33 TaxID=3416711 RepID=UPI003CEC532B
MQSKIERYKEQYTEDDMPGYDAIALKEKEVYGEQEPMHWATVVPYELGGEDPLWAVDCFVSEIQQSHLHFITLGFSNLYFDDKLVEEEVSGFGFEITFRYLPLEGEDRKIAWPANLLQNIAKYVFKTQRGFDQYHYMSANGPLRVNTDTEITAFVFYIDSQMGTIETPHGSVKFLQLYGLTSGEYIGLRNKDFTAKELLDSHRVTNPLLITDLNRR